MATIEERNGSYRITVSCGTDIFGKKIRHRATFTPEPGLTQKKRQKAVEEFAADFERQVRNGIVMEGRKTTLKEFADVWFEEYAPQKLQGGTIEKYKAEMEKVLPELGHLMLTELRPHTLNRFFSAMAKDGARRDGKAGGYSRATIAKTQNVLSSILHTAADWELIDRNPMDKVRLQGERTADKLKFFTAEQAAQFLEFIESPYKVRTKEHKRVDDTGKMYLVPSFEREMELPEQIRVLFLLAIYGGLRKGELLALKFSDIDYEEDTVSITKSVSVVNGQQIVKEPKTKNSRREITIPHFLTLRIKALERERLRYRLSLGDYWKGDNWIFIQLDGKQMGYSTPYSAFHDALLRQNENAEPGKELPLIPFHGLRHTSATLLIAGKQDLRTVSSRLGHAQASTTMNVYAHALQESDKRAAYALEDMLTKQA